MSYPHLLHFIDDESTIIKDKHMSEPAIASTRRELSDLIRCDYEDVCNLASGHKLTLSHFSCTSIRHGLQGMQTVFLYPAS